MSDENEPAEWRQWDIHRWTYQQTIDRATAVRDNWQSQGWTCAILWNGGHDLRVVGSRPGGKRKRLKLDPCLADGTSWTIDDSASATLMESIQLWMDEGTVGEAITIEIVEMTDREVEELPDI